MILLDTHVLIWSRQSNSPLGPQCLQLIEESLSDGNLAVSAFSFWEVAMLKDKGRLEVARDIFSWRSSLLEDGLFEIPVDGQIGIRANTLPNFHPDPAARIIVATALDGPQLLTADELILR
ncbi:MAG: type II toxin-antitoxin system VapC family toxin, partial [Chloroflexi bacterium]|nr:type II toxin-antitoxin system VapC family toxin [Chloroflexota bacterium]